MGIHRHEGTLYGERVGPVTEPAPTAALAVPGHDGDGTTRLSAAAWVRVAEIEARTRIQLALIRWVAAPVVAAVILRVL